MKKAKKAMALLLAVLMLCSTSLPILSTVASAAYTGTLRVDGDGNFTVLQMGDMQAAYPLPKEWLNALRLSIAAAEPDLIVLTGDNITGVSDAAGFRHTAEQIVNEFKDYAGNLIPFSVTYGNHDPENGIGIDEQDAIYAEFDNYLELQGESTTAGTGYIDIKNAEDNTTVERVILVNTHDNEGGGYGRATDADVNLVNTWTSDPSIKCIAFQHIPLREFYTGGILTSGGSIGAYATASDSGISGTYQPASGTTGIYTEQCCCSYNSTIDEFNALAKSNVYGLFYGHDHGNTLTGISTVGGNQLRQGYGGGLNVQWNGAHKSMFSFYTLNKDYNGVNDAEHFTKETYEYASYLNSIGGQTGMKTLVPSSGTYVSDLGAEMAPLDWWQRNMGGANFGQARTNVEEKYGSSLKYTANGNEVNADLKRGCSTGTYVAVGYRESTTYSQAITGIFVVYGSANPNSIDVTLQDGTVITYNREDNNCDLMQGAAGSNQAHLYITKDPKAGAPITKVFVTNESYGGGYSHYGCELNGSVPLAYGGSNIPKDYGIACFAEVSGGSYVFSDWSPADFDKGCGGSTPFIYMPYATAGSTDVTRLYYNILTALDKYGDETNTSQQYTSSSFSAYNSARTALQAELAKFNNVYHITDLDTTETQSKVETFVAAYKALAPNLSDDGRQVKSSDATVAKYTVAVPETIYLAPNASSATTGQFYLNNVINSNGEVAAEQVSSPATTGSYVIQADGAEEIKVTVKRMIPQQTGNKFQFGTTANQSGYTDTAVSIGLSSTSASAESLSGTISSFSYTNGLTPGDTGMIQWDFEVTTSNSEVEHVYAYTVVYAPFVGSLAAFGAANAYKNSRYAVAATSSVIYGVQGITSSSSSSFVIGGTTYKSNNSGTENNGKVDSTGSYVPSPLTSNPIASGGLIYWGGTNTPPNTLFSGSGSGAAECHCSSSTSEDKAMQCIGGTGYINYDSSRFTNVNDLINLGMYVDYNGITTGKIGNVDKYNIAGYVYTLDQNHAVKNQKTFASASTKDQSNAHRYPLDSFGDANGAWSLSGVKYIVCRGTYDVRNESDVGVSGGTVSTYVICVCELTAANKSTLRSHIATYEGIAPQSSQVAASDYTKFTDYMNELVNASYKVGNPANTDTSDTIESKFNTLKNNQKRTDTINGVANTKLFTTEINYGIHSVLNGYGTRTGYKVDTVLADEFKYEGPGRLGIGAMETINVQPYDFTADNYNYIGWLDGEGYLAAYCPNGYTGTPGFLPQPGSTLDANAMINFYEDFNTSSATNYGYVTTAGIQRGLNEFYFYYKPDDATLTYDLNGGTASGCPASVTDFVGDSFVIGFTPTKAGAVFDGWEVSSGNTQQYDAATNTFTFAPGGATLKAKWIEKRTLNIDSNGGAAANNLIYLPEGKTSYSATDSTMTAALSYEDDSDITITGTRYSEASGEVILNPVAYVYLEYGKSYTFSFTSTNNISDFYVFAPSGNHCNFKSDAAVTQTGDLYHYEKTVTVGTNSGDSSWGNDGVNTVNLTGVYSIRIDQDSYKGDGSYTITDLRVTENTESAGVDNRIVQLDNTYRVIQNPTRERYKFNGWTLTGGGTVLDNGDSIIYTFKDSDGTLTANWLQALKVTFKSEGEVKKTVDVIQGNSLGGSIYSAPAREGYQFIGWFDETTQEPFDSTTVINANKTVVAEWFYTGADTSFTSGSAMDKEIGDSTAAVTSVSALPSGKEANTLYNGSISPATTFTTPYGIAAISSGVVNYKPINMQVGANIDTFYTGVQNRFTYKYDGSSETIEMYSYAPVSIYPETNILYEVPAAVSSTDAGNGCFTNGTSGVWQLQSSNPENTYGGIESDIYGYSGTYANDSVFSDNSAMKTLVSSTMAASASAAGTGSYNWPMYTFTFTGTGFDINCDCNSNCGLLAVKVKDANGNQATYPGTTKKVTKSVNTFLSDTAIYQAPVVHIEGLAYGTYTVECTVAYNAAFDMSAEISSASASAVAEAAAAAAAPVEITVNADGTQTADLSAILGEDFADCDYYCVDDGDSLSGLEIVPASEALVGGDGPRDTGYGDYTVCIDSVRIYNPAGHDTTLTNDGIKTQYINDSELDPDYRLLRDKLTSASFGSGESAVLYVEKINNPEYTDDDHPETDETKVIVKGTYPGASDSTYTLAKYNQQGANNEIYISDNKAVAFKLSGWEEGKRVHVTLRSPRGSDATASVNGHPIILKTATEMYYDITGYVDSDGYIVVSSSSGLIAIGSVKFLDGTGIDALTVGGKPTDSGKNLLKSAALKLNNVGANPAPELEGTVSVPVTFGNAGSTTAELDLGQFTLALDGSEWSATAVIKDGSVFAQAFTEAGLGEEYKLGPTGKITVTAEYKDGEWVCKAVGIDEVTAILPDFGGEAALPVTFTCGDNSAEASIIIDLDNLDPCCESKKWTALGLVSSADIASAFAGTALAETCELVDSRDISIKAVYADGKWALEPITAACKENLVPTTADAGEETLIMSFTAPDGSVIQFASPVNVSEMEMTGDGTAAITMSADFINEKLAALGLGDKYIAADSEFTVTASYTDGGWALDELNVPLADKPAPEIPDEPGTPEEPDTPDEPDIPDEPDTPDEPIVPSDEDPDEPVLSLFARFIKAIKTAINTIFKKSTKNSSGFEPDTL